MRALVVDSTAPGRIALREVPEPVAAKGETLVEVRAVSVNRGEVRAVARSGDGTRPGWDFAGIVAPGSEGPWLPGTRVAGLRRGETWAESVAVASGSLAALPDAVSFGAGAALGTAGVTALRVLRLGPAILGRRVLVSGASGGVGRYLIQLAHLGGAEVTGLVGAGSSRAAGLRELGADRVVSDVEDLHGRYDLVLDSVGGPTLGRLLTRVDPDGTLVMFGNSSEEPTTFSVRDLYLDAATRLRAFEVFHGDEPFGPDLAILVRLVQEGRLDPQVADEIPWLEAPDAIERLRTRDVAGKMVLTIDV